MKIIYKSALSNKILKLKQNLFHEDTINMLKYIASMAFFSAVGARRRRMEAKTSVEVLNAIESNDLGVQRDQTSRHEARKLESEYEE